MPVYLLNEQLVFPDPAESEPDGLLALGGDLSEARLLLAYEKGIFPWYNPGDPILWWSPDPRAVIFPQSINVSKSMRNVLNRGDYELRYDHAFLQLMTRCMEKREEEGGTWISEEIIAAYSRLHEMGLAHSVEVWKEGQLVGGLYGTSLGGCFFGESMFSDVPNASKIALIHLARKLNELGFSMIDCQIYTEHLGSLGAVQLDRKTFLEKLKKSLEISTLIGNWGEMPIFTKT